MSNTIYNKVTIDGTTYIDLSQDTVSSANHIRQGYIGHLNDGTTVTGTYSGITEPTWTTLKDGNSTIVSDSPNYIIVNDYTTPFAANQLYRVTWGTTVYYCTPWAADSAVAYDGYAIGNPSVVGFTNNSGEPFLFYRDSATRLIGATTASAGTIYLKIELMTDPGSYGWTTRDISGATWATFEAPEVYYLWISNFFNTNDHIEQGSMWRITWNDLIFICTATSNSYPDMEVGTGYCLGNATMSGGTSGQGEPFLCVEYTYAPDLIVATKVSQQPTFSIEKWEPQNGMNLISKTITTNGTYHPSEDDADGYSEVVVNVSGNTTTYTTVFDEDMIMHDGSPGWAVYEYYLIPFTANQTYRVTFNGTEYICQTQADIGEMDTYDGYCIGNASYAGGTNTGEPFLLGRFDYDDPDPNHVQLGLDSYATGTVHVKLELAQEGGSTLISKIITANGEYDPTDDNADGYSSVTVNVEDQPVLWETQYDGSVTIQDWGEAPWYYVNISDYFQTHDEIRLGDKYRIRWKGVDYICTAQEIVDHGGSGYCLGNCTLDGGTTGNNEPFLAQLFFVDDLLFSTQETSGSFQLRIDKAVPINTNYKWELLYYNPQQLINGSSGEAYFILSQFFQTHDPIAQGDVYRISWGNNTYICTAEEIVTVNGYTGYCLGNATLYNGTTGNNEPFVGMEMYTSQDFAFATTDEPNQRIGLMIEKRVLASTGGEYTRTVVCPEQTFSNAALEAYAMLTDAQRLIDGEHYIITYDNVEYICSCEELYNTDRFLGSIQITWSSSSPDVIFPFCVEDWNNLDGPAVHALDSSQHTIKIEHLELLTTGTTLVLKTITTNGTYDPADDNADGYSSVTVNVSGGGGGTPSLQAKTNINPTTSSQTITADNGYDGLSSVQINAMPSGTVTAPSSISGTTATVSTGSNTLTLTKSVSVTPNVTTAGYVSTGTAGNSSISLTANVTTKAAATITPGTTNQTIASGTYLTGTQTISGDTNLVAGNIKSGTTIFGVTGSYTGSGSSKNIQYIMGRYEVSATSYTATNLSITVSKAGSYKCYWVMDRNTTSGTSGSQLYKNNSAVGSAHTSWTYNNNNRNGMNCEETLTLAVNDVLVVRARSRSTSYICGVSNFIIVEQ